MRDKRLYNSAMKIITVIIALVTLSFLAAAADIKLGRSFEPKDTLTVGQVLESPGQYVGKTVQVKGKVTEVCLVMGCWMSLTDADGHLLRVQVDHEGAIVFPKSAIGKVAIAEGKLGREELTQKEAIAAAEHEASENNRKFDASTIKSGKVVYEIAGTGAIILDR